MIYILWLLMFLLSGLFAVLGIFWIANMVATIPALLISCALLIASWATADAINEREDEKC